MRNSIRVHRGRSADGKQLKPFTATFEVSPTWTEKSARKKAESFAANFEKACKEGTATDTRQRFQEYCEYVIDLKESTGVKHSTIVRYRELTQRIYPEIGHIKLKGLRVDHLNTLYTSLSKMEIKTERATASVDLAAFLKGKALTRAALAEKSGVSLHSVYDACKGKAIGIAQAKAIAKALNHSVDKLFIITTNGRTLSAKTVIEYHRLISTVLAQAEKKMLVPFNMASRATLPKAEKKEPNYFQPEQVAAIRDALDTEPIKWRMITHLFLITGARRGEIIGLKWDKVDFINSKIYICTDVLYRSDIGIYEDTPKTERSKRFVALPAETMLLLRQYQAWQKQERLRLGSYYVNQGFVFCRDDGGPMHPDSVTSWLSGFSKRHGLPHVNPHAFRHTMASLLYFNHVDTVSISKRLGHSQVSTTANIYAHVIEAADQQNADLLSDIFLKHPAKEAASS